MPFTPRLVFVTAPGVEKARALAAGILEHRLAACVNLVPGVESHYWWQGKLDHGNEVLMLIKSSAEQFDALAAHIRRNHPYECPEIVAVPPQEIAPAYLAWWHEAMQLPPRGST